MTQQPPLEYRLRFPEAHAHWMDVELHVPSPRESTLELWLPVWTPGSYLVREYSRNLEGLQALNAQGDSLPAIKTRKNRWEVPVTLGESVHIRYRIYGHELSVRTNWIEDRFAFLVGAATFLAVKGREQSPHIVEWELPRRWNRVCTSLVEDDGNPVRFRAEDLDELIDSPFLAGAPRVMDFEVDGVPFALVNQGGGELWDDAKASKDVRGVVECYRDMFGSLPLSRYLFLNLILEAGGGLEHKHSSVLMTSRFSFRHRQSYVDWLGLVSHEFFHVWNVKRSRPLALGPFDYENEVYTRTLWVAEGVTAYYTDLMPHRAGVTTFPEFLTEFSKAVARVQATPGRGYQSLEEASFDAWIRLYRPDENTQNTTVSYYTKGALVAWLLDVEIRKASRGERSLDDLMRKLFTDYSGDRGFTDAEVQREAETVADRDLGTFFDRYIRGVDEIDYTPALEYLGLRFQEEDRSKPWLGLEARALNGRLRVEKVRRDGPAAHAGLSPGDELLAAGGYRLPETDWNTRLQQQYRPGDRVELLVSRREAVRVIPVTLAESPRETWQLEDDPEASSRAREAQASWRRTSLP